MIFAINTDNRHGAGPKGRGAKVCGRKGFAFALVVAGGIGDNLGAALVVYAFHAQVTEIFGADSRHVASLFFRRAVLPAGPADG